MRAHLDHIATTDQERGYVMATIGEDITNGGVTIHDWAKRLSDPIEFCGVQASPGALPGTAWADKLAHTPRLATDNGALFLHDGDKPGKNLLEQIERRIYFPREQVYEVVRLPYH